MLPGSASAYEELRPLDAPAFAYEFLCRNPEFLADHARLARKGRASYLGPRSVGHEDPGAASTALIIGALRDIAQRQAS